MFKVWSVTVTGLWKLLTYCRLHA